MNPKPSSHLTSDADVCHNCGLEIEPSRTFAEVWIHKVSRRDACGPTAKLGYAEPASEYAEPPRVEGKHRFMAGTCVDCGHPLDDVCTANLSLPSAPDTEVAEKPKCECEHGEALHWPESKDLYKLSRCSYLGCDCERYVPTCKHGKGPSVRCIECSPREGNEAVAEVAAPAEEMEMARSGAQIRKVNEDLFFVTWGNVRFGTTLRGMQDLGHDLELYVQREMSSKR